MPNHTTQPFFNAEDVRKTRLKKGVAEAFQEMVSTRDDEKEKQLLQHLSAKVAQNPTHVLIILNEEYSYQYGSYLDEVLDLLAEKSLLDYELINRKDKEGDTLLHYFIRRAVGDPTVFRSLLHYGCDPEILDREGNTVLGNAKNSRHHYDDHSSEKFCIVTMIGILNEPKAPNSRQQLINNGSRAPR